MAKKFNQRENAEREKRWRYFNENVLPFLALEYDVRQPNAACYIAEDTPKGNLTIYPKGDKIQLTDGSWVSEKIIDWLKKNIIKEKF